MDRKSFLSAVLATGAGVYGGSRIPFRDKPVHSPLIPAYLKTGDVIGITSPAGYITHEEIAPAVERFRAWGYEVKIGSTIGKRHHTFGGTDNERLADFQEMLDNPTIHAIMCARGGYGAVRLIDQLDFTRFVHHPKWIIGFSDITVFHCHLSTNYGLASIHSKMCNSFPDNWERAEPIQVVTIDSLRKVLKGDRMIYAAMPAVRNRFGTAEGVLVGGNLKTIESLAGSASDLDTRNKLLFVEDTGEYHYSIDRMFWNLKRSGKLNHLKGLIIGGFKIKSDTPGEEFGKDLYEIVMEKVNEFDYPVGFAFPVGHQKDNFSLKCGVLHRLVVNENGTRLSDIKL